MKNVEQAVSEDRKAEALESIAKSLREISDHLYAIRASAKALGNSGR